MNRRHAVMLLFAGLALSPAACSGPTTIAGRKPVFPVAGRVFVDGKPAAGARVMLLPTTDDPDTPRPRGYVLDDGSFVLSTYDARDGAPAGDYQVVVEWRLPEPTNSRAKGPDLLNGRYAAAKTPLRATVRNSRNEPVELSLTNATRARR